MDRTERRPLISPVMRNRQHHRTPWTPEQVERLRQLVEAHQPAGTIANEMGAAHAFDAFLWKPFLPARVMSVAEELLVDA